MADMMVVEVPRKRSNPYAGFNPSKKPKNVYTVDRARLNNPPRRQYISRQYVNRTPGGQIVADNHYFDTERTSTAIAANGASWANTEYDPNTSAMLCLFAPTVGDDITNRTGRKVFVKKIRIQGSILISAQSAAATSDLGADIRIIVYQDCQTNAQQSQGENLIDSGAGSDAIHMFQNLASLGRFKVLKDKMIVIDPGSMTGAAGAIEQSGQYRNFKMTVKPMCWVNYNATNGGTVADVVDNSFHLIANVRNTGLAPFISYKVRTVFSP